jgi:hypothetical protein
MHLDTLRPQLECRFRQHPVQLVHLFGSQATGQTHADSLYVLGEGRSRLRGVNQTVIRPRSGIAIALDGTPAMR